MGDYSTTRRSLHGVAELLMAGPQWRASREISLRVLPGGFGTTHEPDIRLDGVDLVAGEHRLQLNGATYAGLADAIGVTAEGPTGVYEDTGEAGPDDLIDVEAVHARTLTAGLNIGLDALRAFAPDVPPILWPEHFDVGITVDEVNYGVSPGDAYCPEPYAYVGPWAKREGEFWNAPFGAARPVRELGGFEAVTAFFKKGSETQ